MAVISFRVSEDVKRRMDRLRHINWSEVLRQAILERLEVEESRNLARAVLLNERNVIVPEEGWSSVEEIRKWREGVRWKR